MLGHTARQKYLVKPAKTKIHQNWLYLFMPWTDSYKWNHLNFLSWVIELKAHLWLEMQCAPIPLRNCRDIPRTPVSSPANKRSRVAGHVTMGGACTSAALA